MMGKPPLPIGMAPGEDSGRARGDQELTRQLAGRLIDISTIEAEVGTSETRVNHLLAAAPKAYEAKAINTATAIMVSEVHPADQRSLYLVASAACTVRVTLYS